MKSLIPLAVIASAHIPPITQAQIVSQPNPLDFPGTGPVGPTPGGPGGYPLIPLVPPIIINPPDVTGEGPFIWTGGASGQFFTAASWQDSIGSSLIPSGFVSGTAINTDLTASNVQFSAPATATQIYLGTGSLTLTNSAIQLFLPAGGGILGNASSAPSLLALQGSSWIAARYLRSLNIQAGSSLVNLYASRSEHQAGTPFTGSTINLTGGSLVLLFTNASITSPATIADVAASYFSSISIGGSTGQFGLNPLVAEAGDNLIMRPVTSTTDGGLTTYIGGWGFSAIPEPSALLLAALATPLALRRKRLP